jgi:hypothetical protein
MIGNTLPLSSTVAVGYDAMIYNAVRFWLHATGTTRRSHGLLLPV